MFNLVYRDGAPENAGHYECIPTDSNSLKVGQAVHLASGKAVLADGSAKVYGVVAGEKANGNVTVLKVDTDMIFKVATTAAPATKGTKVALDSTASKVTASAPASGKFGAIMVDKLDATAAGDFVLVSFE